jgi:hypothetical protein
VLQDRALGLKNHVLRHVLTTNILPFKLLEIDAGATMTLFQSQDTVVNGVVMKKQEDTTRI